MSIVVSCACDGLVAARLHQFLLNSRLSRLAIITCNDDEITLHDENSAIDTKDLRRLLEGFLGSNVDLTEYSVNNLGDVFTVGMKKEVHDLFTRCEMCGFIAQHDDELLIHKSLHATFVPL